MQAIVLKSQLHSQAADFCSELTKEKLKGENGVALIVNAVYQRDALLVILEAFYGFSTLHGTNVVEQLQN